MWKFEILHYFLPLSQFLKIKIKRTKLDFFLQSFLKPYLNFHINCSKLILYDDNILYYNTTIATAYLGLIKDLWWEFFAKRMYGFQPLTLSQKSSLPDVWHGPENSSVRHSMLRRGIWGEDYSNLQKKATFGLCVSDNKVILLKILMVEKS